jgi:hypothetical protein
MIITVFTKKTIVLKFDKITLMYIFYKIRHLLFWLVVCLFSTFTAYLAYNNSQSSRFGDEVAHWIGGHYALIGKELYKDLQFNHQPLNYYFSTAVEFFTSPDNSYLYVSRQRLSILLYGLFWNILYYILLGPYMLLFSLIFEVSKYWYSGHKLLGETLAVYPTVFITGIFIQSLFFKKEISRLKLFLTSTSSFVAGFSLLPIWLVIVPMNLFIIISQKYKKKAFLWLSAPFLTLCGIMFLFINPYNLYKETYLYNVQYFLPVTEQYRPTILQLILFPFYIFTAPFSESKFVIGVIIFLFFITGLISFREKKFIKWIILFGLFILSNFFRVNDYNYTSFHLLPWYGILLVSVISLNFNFYTLKKQKRNVFFITQNIILVTLFIYLLYSQKDIWKVKDLATEHYINYSYSETYGRAINILKSPKDQLIVVPVDPLIYWIAKIDIGTRLLEFYPWIYPIPEYREEVLDKFINDPPEFFVDVNIDKSKEFESKIYNIVLSKYIRLNYMGKPSKLYVLEKKYKSITDDQWREIEPFMFTRL